MVNICGNSCTALSLESAIGTHIRLRVMILADRMVPMPKRVCLIRRYLYFTVYKMTSGWHFKFFVLGLGEDVVHRVLNIWIIHLQVGGIGYPVAIRALK